MAKTIKVDERHERYAVEARDADCPRDQVSNFLTAGYYAFPKILPFHSAARAADRSDGPDEIALGGTRYFGKTHAVMAQVGLDDCQRVPGLKYLFLRKIMKSASESLEDIVYRVFKYVRHEFIPSEGRLYFPNTGSRILIGGYNNESDIDKYLGIEYDGVVIEEATQLSQRKIDSIYGSVRTSVPGWRARKYLTTNPDGIGLTWFKQRFVSPWREHTERWTKFFNCSYKDNPLANPEYIRYLENLTGPLARAWRDGDWDAFEGMAFPNWDESIHVIDPFPIPPHWLRWRATDYGYSAPWCTLWFAKDPELERVIVYREAYETYLTSTQQAERIRDLTLPGENIAIHYADPSMWGKKEAAGTVTTTADDYLRKGIVLMPADNNRLIGKRKVDEALAIKANGMPGLQIFRDCYNLIRTLPQLPFDKFQTEDVDTKAEDHAYDALRYGLTNTRLPEPPKRDAQKVIMRQSPLVGMRGL